jgi:hypothetical protein
MPSSQDTRRFPSSRNLIGDALKADLSRYRFMFLGYSLMDPDFTSVYDNVFYSLGSFAPRHWAVFRTEPTRLEADDLRHHGLEPLSLDTWEGTSPNQKLESLVQALLRASSDTVHIRHFFRGLSKGERVPVVITSRLHEHEQYVYHPRCDVHVARAIEDALAKVGCATDLIADVEALENADDILRNNVVLVCSPFGNAFTKWVFDRAAACHSPMIGQRFDQSGRVRTLADPGSAREFASTDPAYHPNDGTPGTEYGLIARYNNPWTPGRYIFVFAGLFAMGTHAIGDFLSHHMNYSQLRSEDDHFVALLGITYTRHYPYSYEYDVDDLTVLS